MKLYCPQCDELILAEDVNLDNQMAKCRTCDTVFSFEGKVPGTDPERDEKRDVASVDLPNHFRVEHWGGGMSIVWSWRTWRVIPLIFFCLVWNGFLLFWYAKAASTQTPIVFKVFPLVHVAVGVGLAYLVVTTLCNKTTIRVDPNLLSVKHGPIPWPGIAGSTQRTWINSTLRRTPTTTRTRRRRTRMRCSA